VRYTAQSEIVESEDEEQPEEPDPVPIPQNADMRKMLDQPHRLGNEGFFVNGRVHYFSWTNS